MTYAVREFATVALSDEPARAEMQVHHLVSLIGERKLFMIVFELPENYETSDYVEPADDFVQTTGTQAGLTVELMRNGKLFTLGHPGDTGPLVPLARKDGTSVEVNQNEVLMPDEVGRLLVEYIRTGSIDTSGWALREFPWRTTTTPSPPAGVCANSPGAPTPPPRRPPSAMASARSKDDVRFSDVFVSRANRYSVGIELDSGRHYVSIPVSNGVVDYEEYYAISPEQSEVFLADRTAAIAFAEACRRHQHDDLLILKPGTNRGTPV